MTVLPKSLRRQFLLVLGALFALVAVLVVAVVWDLNQAHVRLRQLTDREMRVLRATTRFASLTESVSTATANVLLASDAQALARRSESLERDLAEIDRLQSQLIQEQSTDVLVDLEQRSQAYSTAVNVMLQLRQEGIRDEKAIHEGLAAAMKKRQGTAEGPVDLSDLMRLAIASTPEEVEAISVPAKGDEAELRAIRLRQLNRQETLRRYSDELWNLGAEMTRLAQECAGAAERDYDASMAAHIRASRASAWRLAALLITSIVTGYWLVRHLVQGRILHRIDVVSSWLRGKETTRGKPGIPVHGQDEIASMARAVEDFMEDRRQLVAAKRDLEAARKAAEQASRFKSEFLANMSHEIRTPMNAILGYAQLMSRDPTLPREQLARLHPINSAGQHLLALINDILEMSKIEAGKLTFNESAFNLRALLNELIEIYGARARAKGITLTLERTSDVPRNIISDEGKLRQTLLNLIGNAVKFSSQGAVMVLVEAEKVQEGQVLLRFAVADCGPGLTDEEIRNLFQPFVQSSAGMRFGGTGLGLAISRRYARMLGGDITVRSEPGAGAIFTLTITATLAPESIVVRRGEAPRILRLAEGQPPIRILVVDDVTMNRELLESILRPMGFETRGAGNGADAVRIFQDWKPQAIFMDIRMPVMDGYEATRRIRAMSEGRNVCIVALTATVFEEDKAAALTAGADEFMRKPFDQDELLTVLGNRLNLRYIYEEAAQSPATNVTEDFSHIPAALKAELQSACEKADYDRLMEICDRLDANGHTSAARTIRERVSAFDYALLSKLLAEDSGGTTGSQPPATASPQSPVQEKRLARFH